MTGARRAALAAVSALGLALGASVPHAAAETVPPAALGWWSRRAAAQPLGEGAFEVAAGVSGPESVAAVRVRVADGAAQPRLVLTEVPGVAPADNAGFRACLATSAWEPADGGEWEQRPSSDCSAAVEALRVDPSRWAVDVAPLLAGGTDVDVVLEPSPPDVVPGLPAPAVFTLTFERVEVVTGDAGGGIPPGTVTPPVPDPPAGTGASAVAPATPRVPARSAPRPAPLPATPATAPPTTGTPDGTESALGAAGTERVAIDAPTFDLLGTGGDDRPWGRLLVLVPLSALAGVAAAAVRAAGRRVDAPA